jgi:PAS domain S-box-containing protein
VEDHLQSVAVLKKQEIEKWVHHLKHAIAWQASSPQMIRDAATLCNYSAGDPEYLAAHDSLVAEFGRIEDLQQISALFFLNSASGQIIASSDTSREGQFRNNEPWFIQGKTSTYVSGIFHSLSLGHPTMIITAPVTDIHGQLMGVIGGHANLHELSEVMLERIGLGETGETYLVNQNNLLLSESRFVPGVVFKKWIFTEGVSRALEGESGVGLYLDYRDEPVIGAYCWMEDRRIVLLAEIDQAEAFASVTALRNTILWVGVCVAVLVGLIGSLVARTITKPLHQLVMGANEIGRGNLDHRIETGTRDELGKLAAAFNDMASNRKQTEEEIRQSEARLKFLTENMADIVWMVDLNFRTTYVSPSINKVLGFTPEERKEQSLEEMMPPESLKLYEELFVREFDKEENRETDLERYITTTVEYYHKDGSTIWLESTMKWIRDTKGDIIGIHGVSRDISERKRREEEIRARHAELSALYDFSIHMRTAVNIPELLHITLEKTCHLFHVEDGAVTLLSPDRNQFAFTLGKGIWKVSIDQPFPVDQGISGLVLKTGKYYVTEDYSSDTYALALASGHQKKIGPAVAVPLASDKELMGVLVVSRRQGGAECRPFSQPEVNLLNTICEIAGNALHRLKLYEEVKQAESNYRSIFNNVSEGIFQRKPDGCFLRVNPAMARILGFASPEELLSSSVEIAEKYFLEPEQCYEYIRQMNENGLVKDFEFQVYREDGAAIWVSESSQAVKDDEGNIQYYEGICIDITEKKQAEDLMRVERKQLLSIFESIDEAIYVADPVTHEVLYANSALRNLFGAEPVGKVCYDFFQHKNTPCEFCTNDIILKKKGEPYHWEYENPVLNKAFMCCDKIIKWSDGRDVRFEMAIDITDRMRAEEEKQKLAEELQSLNETLEKQIRNRTKRLAEAMQATEAANRAKSDFLASMSHELRTPLNAIIGFSEVLADKSFGELNNRQKRYVDNILTSGRHLLDLINDILDLSKVEAGKMELELTEISIEEVLSDSLIMIKEKAYEHGIRLNVDIPQGLSGFKMEADERKLKQVLFNLLSNAVKFTPDSGDISVSARRLSFNNGYWQDQNGQKTAFPIASGKEPMTHKNFLEISVADTGIGIAPEDQERVFSEFEQIDSSYARQQAGTGLGLSLTQKLVELHGGIIRLQSEGENKGSTFTFWLPEIVIGKTEKKPSDMAGSVFETENGEKLPALVVEDNPQAAELLCGVLAEAGFSATVALDGEKALEVLKTLKPCVILLDILLPEMSGWQVLEAVKSQPETRDIPVIVVSITEDRKLGFSRGVLEWFVKPVDRGALIKALRKAKTKGGASCRVVLVIDDDPNMVELTEDILRSEGYTVLSALGGREGINKAVQKAPDVILLDLMMPGMTGFEVIERLQRKDETRNIPIMVYTSKDLTAAERDLLNRTACAVIAKADGEELLLEMLYQTVKNIKEE